MRDECEFPALSPQPKFVLKGQEDNQSCIAMTNNPKFTPRTKHFTIKYHHFWKHVKTYANPDGFNDLNTAPKIIKLQTYSQNQSEMTSSSSFDQRC